MIGNYFFSSSDAAAYEIEQSLRFDGSSYMTRTPSSAGSRTTWTLSFWHKRSELGTGTLAGYQTVLAARSGSGDDTVRFDTSNRFKWFLNDTSDGYLDTSALHRDTSAWAHYVVVADYSNSTANDRNRMYINGVEVTDFSSRTNAPLNFSGGINNTVDQVVGRRWTGSTYYLKGYLAEVHLIDGTAVTDATDFGEYDDNGVWRPIAYTGGSYGTNGFYLKFDSSATNGIGHDHSGNGNNFTAYGFTTSGTGTDVMSDTPTNNFATWNPLAVPLSGSPVYEEGNLYFDLNDGPSTISTIGVKSGKWYCEIRAEGTMSQRPLIGLNYINPTSQGEAGDRVWPGWDVAYAYNGNKWLNYSTSSYGSSWSNGDFIGIALDLDSATQTVTFYRNGTSQGAINLPASDKTWHVSCSSYGVDGDNLAFTANFGQKAFEYTQPSGYNSWCTANLPAPDIADGSEYFNTILYTGNATNRSITGVGFQPDFVWIKSRSSNTDHRMIDVVRGSSKVLRTNTTDQEYTSTTLLTSFNSDGFSLGTDNSGNANGENFVAWCWKAGGSGSSNTSGSITSTVSASPTSGFSIVTYSGAGTNATVGHGLGVAPKMIWIKTRNGSNDWAVYHADLGASKIIYLNLTYDQGGSGAVFGSSQTEPTSTVFTVGNHTYSGQSGSTYVAYCFAEVEGFSRIGKYTGNGSDDGVFIYTGFRAKWLLLKSAISTADDWVLMDVERSQYNVINDYFTTNHGNTEVTNSTETNTDFAANGIKLRDSNGKINASGSTYIFMAFAEHPFGGADITPATAR